MTRLGLTSDEELQNAERDRQPPSHQSLVTHYGALPQEIRR